MTTIQYEPVFGLNRENLEKILNISEKDLATKQYVDNAVSALASEEVLNTKVSKVEGKGLSTNDFTDEYKIKVENASTKEELGKKVDKIEGKGLSANDFTDEYKDTLDNLQDYESRLDDLESTDNPYKGKTWTALGDDMTVLSPNSLLYTPNRHNYMYWVNQKLEFGTLNNLGLEGSTLSTCKTTPNSFTQRMKSIPEKSNLITVFGGYNDLWSNNTKLGTIDDTNTDTIYGALNTLATYLLMNHPKSIIVFFTMLHWTWEKDGISDNAPYVTNQNGVTTELINQAIRDVCAKYSIPVIDLEKNSGIFPGTFDQTTNTATKFPHFSYYTCDGLHLNERGHQKISNLIVSELLKLDVGYIFD